MLYSHRPHLLRRCEDSNFIDRSKIPQQPNARSRRNHHRKIVDRQTKWKEMVRWYAFNLFDILATEKVRLNCEVPANRYDRMPDASITTQDAVILGRQRYQKSRVPTIAIFTR
jgi:hypothetical protein